MNPQREPPTLRRIRLQERAAAQRIALAHELAPVGRLYARVDSSARRISDSWPLLALVAVPLAALVVRRGNVGAWAGRGLMLWGLWRRSAPLRAVLTSWIAGQTGR